MSRIGIVCGAGIVSGKEIMAIELAEGLREKGAHIEFVTSFWGSAEFRRRLRELGFAMHVMRLGFISATLSLESLYMTAHQIWRWPELILQYRRFLRTLTPRTVIHTNWHHLLLLRSLLNTDRDIFWVHEVIPNKWQYRKVFGWLARRLQYFVPVSHAVGESLQRIGIPKSKIRVIHNGISDPLPAGATVAPKADGLVVGIVGQIGSWKGHEDLLEAFALVSDSMREAQLHIFGRGSVNYENCLKEKSISLGLADRIVWRGFVPDRFDMYGGMNICVVPSRFEDAFPTVAIEAAFFGVPVVATRLGGLPEIIQDGVTGFLVDANQPMQIASRLRTLLGNDQLRHKMGEHARQGAIEKFSRDRFIQDFVRVLEVE